MINTLAHELCTYELYIYIYISNVNWFECLNQPHTFTQLNATVAGETANNEQKSGEASENSDDSDSEDQVYQDFLSRTFEASDTSDDDFIAELIGDESSDTDSQSSVASEDLSDGENIEKPRSPNVSNFILERWNSILNNIFAQYVMR